MSSAILPELQHLRKLLESLPEKGGDSAMSVIIPIYSEITGADSDFAALALLYRTLDQLPEIVTEKFPEKGRRAAALGVVEQFKDHLSPLKLARPYPEYFSRHGRPLLKQLAIFPILEDIEFDSDGLAGQATSIISEIEKMRAKIDKANDLSDASRSFLGAQLVLLERAVLRFETTGVGPFRDSVFSSVGKIYIELAVANPDSTSAKDLMDDFLRLYGLFQAGGDILKLTGPVIAGLLSAPVS